MKVKVIKAGLPSYWYANNIGKEYDVVGIELPNHKFEYKVVGSELVGTKYFDKDDVEIITEGKVMKKSDLRTGDLVVLNSSGVVRVYKDTEQGDIVSGSTWYPLTDYSDDRIFNWTTKSNYDDQFLEVWRPKMNSVFSKTEPSESTHKLIWKRETKTPAQIELEALQTKISELQDQAQKLQGLISK